MYPLTFGEFLINTGMDENVLLYVKKSIEQKTSIEQTIHQSMRQLYLQYLIVGGMPEVVNTFFETHDLNAVRDIQTQILNSIKDDFGRYKDVNGIDKVNEVLKLRAEACLDSLPAQLSKEYKKFQYSLVDVKGHSPEKADRYHSTNFSSQKTHKINRHVGYSVFISENFSFVRKYNCSRNIIIFVL